MSILSRGVNTDRTAMSRNAFGVDHFEPVHLQKIFEAGQRVVAEMLMIDRVVLERFQQRSKIMGFANEDAGIAEQHENARDDIVNVFDVCENVSRRDNLSF